MKKVDGTSAYVLTDIRLTTGFTATSSPAPSPTISPPSRRPSRYVSADDADPEQHADQTQRPHHRLAGRVGPPLRHVQDRHVQQRQQQRTQIPPLDADPERQLVRDVDVFERVALLEADGSVPEHESQPERTGQQQPGALPACARRHDGRAARNGGRRGARDRRSGGGGDHQERTGWYHDASPRSTGSWPAAYSEPRTIGRFDR